MTGVNLTIIEGKKVCKTRVFEADQSMLRVREKILELFSSMIPGGK